MSEVVTRSNLGPEFDLGNIQANKIRLKLGAGLAITPDGTIVIQTTIDPTSPAFYKAAGSVLSDGTLEQGAGCSVSRLSVGRYQITFNSDAATATYPILATMQGLPQNDDYQWAYIERTQSDFKIEIREQDNGGTAGVLRDSGFSFFVPII